MIDNPFRKKLEKFSVTICGIYRFFGLQPNGVTVLAFIVSILAAISIVGGHNTLALILWWISRYFDGTDGIYARQIGKTSRFGAYLDILLDMASYSLMIIAFALIRPEFSIQWNLILFFYVLCIASALSLGSLQTDAKLAVKDNRGLRLATGFAEGGETGIFYSVILLFPSVTHVALPIWIIILFFTVIMRSLLAYREL